MKSTIKVYLWKAVFPFILCMTGLVSCTDDIRIARTLDTLPDIFPDYTDVTIPANIAPLCFKLSDSCHYEKASATFELGTQRFTLKAKKGQFSIPISSWKKLMKEAGGSTLRVTIQAQIQDQWVSYPAFQIFVAPEPIDSWLAYRLIEPGYVVWNEVGIYQRCLENFNESVIVNNKRADYNCINCHSFCMQNPEKMMFHMRAFNSGTLLIDGDRIEKLNTRTDRTSAFTYLSWHPSGKYMAVSLNDPKQKFHTTNPNRIEGFDLTSDVVVYDVNTHEIITTPYLFSDSIFETYPTFSPDGKTLYFCSSDTFLMPDEYDKVKYSLCAISFDPESRRFGTTVDTLYQAKTTGGRSVSFPRVSPDGKFLMCTLQDYGNWSIWHKDADLYIIDLQNRKMIPLDALNSNDVESYHSWSSNSRWVVFSSRRIDGLYTRPFIGYINPDGTSAKPFLLPQKDVDYYHRLMKSYNIPEFITGKVQQTGYRLSEVALNDKGINVKFAESR